ncbi:MAG: hypothetical protein IPG71_01470 [bacterium]|nr:hypothetical protein [bacterium]
MIGLATSRELPELSGGEQLLYQELSRRAACAVVIWDDPQEAWRSCSQIIIRCTWDYSNHLPRFLTWIDDVEKAGIRLHTLQKLCAGIVTRRICVILRRAEFPFRTRRGYPVGR